MHIVLIIIWYYIENTAAKRQDLIISLINNATNSTPNTPKRETFYTTSNLCYCVPQMITKDTGCALVSIVLSRFGVNTCIDHFSLNHMDAIEAVSRGLANFGGGLDIMVPHNVSNVKYLYPHQLDDLCLMRPGVPPAFSSIFSPFPRDVWLLTGKQ